QCQAHLLEVVRALGASSGFAHFLHGGHQQSDQDGNDGDHHEEFNQCEPRADGTAAKNGAQFHGESSLNKKDDELDLDRPVAPPRRSLKSEYPTQERLRDGWSAGIPLSSIPISCKSARRF